MKLLVVVLVLLSSSTALAQARPADDYQLDGIRIGRTVFRTELMARPPWDAPCDVDPVDHRARSIVVYTARPCRARTFAEDTTVALLLKRVEGEDELRQPVQVVMWLGGRYFASRSDFPVQPGDSREAVARALGTPTSHFEIPTDSAPFTIDVHRPGVFSVRVGERVVGFVLGAMPDDHGSEQWTTLEQLYYRFTVGRPHAP